MLAAVEDATGVVPMLKLAVVAPCGTVTDGGTVADPLLLDKVTTALLAAAPVNVSVPVDEFPPITLVGLTVIEESAAVGVELKFALTNFAASMVTLQAPVPLQAPLHPANVEPESGVAVKLTAVPLAKSAEQLEPQEIPGGELATVPVPVPLFVSVRVKDVEGAPVINLLRTFVVAC
jgi:hypothetical protein